MTIRTIVLLTCLLQGCAVEPSVDPVGAADDASVDRMQAGADAAPTDAAADLATPDAGSPPSDAATVLDSSIDATADQGQPGPFAIYLAPNGDDALDGRNETTAIRSLERAHDLIAATPIDADVEVRIGLGTYYDQRVTWTVTHPDHRISFVRWPADATTRPVFDGCVSENGACPGGTWFRLRHSDGEETNLVFHYIHVKRYGTAISLDGARNAEATSNGSNRIFGCFFEDIGNEFNPSLSPSTAAVRLVNSDDNEIINNHFVDVVNTTSGGLIHAIYAAHMSDRNQILRNRFKRSSGDPVRVRDYSNDNVINENRFIQVGTAAGYTDWYCDHDVRDDCTKVGPECPSWGNQFRDNVLDGKFDCSPLGTFEYFQDDTTTGCSPPGADARRLRTSGNTQHTPPCTSE